MKEILKVSNISKSYYPEGIKGVFDKDYKASKAIRAVDDVSFCIREGEIYGLLGPNGAGKSTIIKIITGLQKKNSGSISVCGNDIDSNRAIASQEIGALIEAPAIFPNMTGIDNLRYFAKVEGDISEEDVARAMEIVGLKDRQNSKASTYSMGMKQRLGIAEAIMGKPKLLILDEPTNGLDPEWIIVVRELVRHLAHDLNMAVLISSHILTEMQEVCDRVGFLNHGRLIKETAIEDIGKISEDSKTIASFKVSDNTRAIELIRGEYDKVMEKGGKIFVELYEREVPSINKMLVSNDIDVFEIDIKKWTLEDLFRSLMSRDENMGGMVDAK